MVRKSKKYLVLIVLISIISVLSTSCSGKETLLFLNWGEYINYDMVEAFEKEYNCNVIVDLADSNELFYAKVKSGTTAYDLVCPAEYMVEKMYLNNLLQPLYNNDEELNEYFPTLAKGEVSFMDGVLQIEQKMDITMKEVLKDAYVEGDINRYHMPYFWGTFGLMYNKQLDLFEDKQSWNTQDINNPIFVSDEPDGFPDILQRNNAWDIYFNDPNLPQSEKDLIKSLKVGQYSAVRFSYGAAMTYVNGTSAYLNGSIDGMSSTFNSYSSEMNTWKSGINAWSAVINTWQNETVNPKLNELESAIAGIEGASDVYDVVDTSASLNNYTGRLTPKAVIKVLSGGPNNDQQVYYRWKHSKTASGTWTIADFDYIGAVQAYYDKVYIDNNYYKNTETYTKTEVDDYLECKVDANNKQDFTSAQQLQARTNIGAIGNAEFQQLLDEMELLKNKGLVVVGTQLRFA
jgi:hypothetical protein